MQSRSTHAPGLIRALQGDPVAARAAAATIAGEARALKTVPTLVKLLDDPVPDVRIRAARSPLMLCR